MVIRSSIPRLKVHRSTIVVALLLLIFSTILMLPGLYIKTDPETYYFTRGTVTYVKQYEHGWPYTYLTRFVHEEKVPLGSWPVRPPLPPWLSWSGWTDWRAEESHQFFPLALFLNLIIHPTAIFGLIFLWERRVRKQKHVWQFKLSELALLSSLVAVSLGSFVHERNEYRREKVIVGEIESYQERYYPLEVYSEFPPAFWSRLVGSTVLPECFYRPSDLIYNPGWQDYTASILPVIPKILELKKLTTIICNLPFDGERGDYDPTLDSPFGRFADLAQLRTLKLRTAAGYTVNRHDAGELVKIQQLTRLVITCDISSGAKKILDKHLPNCVIVYRERR